VPFIRATQSHSMSVVESSAIHERLTTVPHVGPRPMTFQHGTKLANVANIRRLGLLAGGMQSTRNEIHMAVGLPDGLPADGVKHGSEVIVYVDVGGLLNAGIPVYRTTTGVLLSPGDAERRIPSRFITDIRTLAGDKVS